MGRQIYNAFLYLAMPAVLARLAWRGVGNRAHLSRVGERFGLGPPVSPRGDHSDTFWVHAVSVGEVQAALPIVRGLLARHPHARVVVSTTTLTGMERVRLALGPEVIHRYAPYDLPGAVDRFLRRVDPCVAVIVETEIWPNLIGRTARRGVPVVLANARLSERSAAGYRRFASLTRSTLAQITGVAAQTDEDARRLIGLGVSPDVVTVIGSTKFDVFVSPSVAEAGQVLRRALGVDRSVWIAASTHEGEDEAALEAFATVRAELPGALLILVPRHPERFTRAAALSRRRGYRVALRSGAGPSDLRAADVFIGDSMGELTTFYAAADVAFVGGSLVDVGGHNMLEPAALGVPVVLGPHLHNFAEISRRLCEEGAAFVVNDAAELGHGVLRLLRDANLRHTVGQQGRSFVQGNRGAGARLLDIIERCMQDRAAERVAS